MKDKVSFEGIGQVAATFYAADEMKAGVVVKLADDATVASTEDGDEPFGVTLTDARDGCVSVQLYGLVKAPCDDVEVTHGWLPMRADGKGGLKKVASGPEYLVVAHDGAGNIFVKI